MERTKLNFNNIKSKLIRLTMMMCLFSFTVFNQNAHAQTYGATVTFGDANQYSFDYTIVCSVDGTTALLTVDFTAPPGGLVPQIHLGAGMFVGLNGPNPYTYTLTGLTACDFSFQFWIASAAPLYNGDGMFNTPANTPLLPLPITLSNFSAAKRGAKTAILDWKTSTEINSDYFRIERSIDGKNWENVNQVKAAGYSYTDLSYSYVDTDPRLSGTSDGIIYYRLKMTDLDGTYEYSNIHTVQFAKNDNDLVSIYPNPASSVVAVHSTKQGMLSIKDYFGRTLKNLSLSEGENVISIDDMPNGMYILEFENGQVKSFIKQ